MIKFQFLGKGGKRHTVQVSHRRVAAIVRKCQDLPGQHLLEYLDENGEPAPINSEDVNAYLNTISGQPFTAKDFRTWAGTVLAAIALAKMEEVDTEARAKKNLLTAIETAARTLGNTTAICRKCYIHPAVTTSYMAGTLAQSLRLKTDTKIADHLQDLKPKEAAVLALLPRSWTALRNKVPDRRPA